MQRSQKLSRRDFLKLSASLPFAWFARPLLDIPGLQANADTPNVIIFIFDAWTAANTSLYGYQRETTPNLERFASRANVYHNHLSAGTFTPPGTASLLTGMYPWKHRAFHLRSGIRREHAEHQIFAALNQTHSALGYSQNKYSNKFLLQSESLLDVHLASGSFNLQNRFLYDLPVFKNDGLLSFTSFEENLFLNFGEYDSSLFLSPLTRLWTEYRRELIVQNYSDQYPKGMPDALGEVFILEDVVDGAIRALNNLSGPSLVFMHFFPPHWPYAPKAGFFKKFRDGWEPDPKPLHPLTRGKLAESALSGNREKYDEFLASWDDEVGRLFTFLEESGLLENSHVLITSDHGEMFERGESGHDTPLLFDPLILVPLVITSPGQTERKDIYANTSSVDILPTLAHLTGNPIPAWTEGSLLPGLGGEEHADHSVYVMDALHNSTFAPLTRFSLSLTKDRYRLTHYHYPEYQSFEFYDLEEDPEEQKDLYPSNPSASRQMQEELQDKLAEVNRPYSSG